MRPRHCVIGDTGMASMWNRIGGLLARLSSQAEMEPAAALALWMVECGGLQFTRGKPVLRFEPHVFFNQWGKDNEELFDLHFQFGSRNGIEGARWQNHRYRQDSGAEWQRFHGEQAAEYRAFALAAKLAGREAACRASSMGGPQIMGFNHALIGHPDAAAMFRNFAATERWQVCGFFDFCASKDLFPALRNHDWRQFAAVYNGLGNADSYAAKIAAEFETARRLLCTAGG